MLLSKIMPDTVRRWPHVSSLRGVNTWRRTVGIVYLQPTAGNMVAFDTLAGKHVSIIVTLRVRIISTLSAVTTLITNRCFPVSMKADVFLEFDLRLHSLRTVAFHHGRGAFMTSGYRNGDVDETVLYQAVVPASRR